MSEVEAVFDGKVFADGQFAGGGGFAEEVLVAGESGGPFHFRRFAGDEGDEQDQAYGDDEREEELAKLGVMAFGAGLFFLHVVIRRAILVWAGLF